MTTLNKYDVLIIGAGAAGLMAAWELAAAGKKTIVVEARNRVGGRIHTIYDQDMIESGAEFVHGDLELTKKLLADNHLHLKEVEGSIWQKKNGKICEQEDFIEDFDLVEKKFRELNKDISVEDFCKQYLNDEKFKQVRYTLKNYVEGYYAGELSKASAMALWKEFSKASDQQFRVAQGYTALVEFLHRDCTEKGCWVDLDSAVNKIEWERDHVTVSTTKGEFFAASKIIVTVPLGVLKSGVIKFQPEIPEKISLANQLGFGPVIKIVLQFSNPFWKTKEVTENKDLSDLSFMFSSEAVPTWWTQHPQVNGMITGWLAGPHAEKFSHDPEEIIIDRALLSLCHIFNLNHAAIKKELMHAVVCNWTMDPFCRGGYSYQVVHGSEYIRQFKEPLENTIYFAGEGLIDGPEIGTVEGALISGRDTAREVIAAL